MDWDLRPVSEPVTKTQNPTRYLTSHRGSLGSTQGVIGTLSTW